MSFAIMLRFTLLCILLAALTRPVQAQVPPSVELPPLVLHNIAADFDEGRNPMYCYFGTRRTVPGLVIHVDSIGVVETPGACEGMGIAFVTRIADPAFLAHALRGLIEATPRFVVVSAFYRTEDVERGGIRFRAARALSVVRGLVRALGDVGPRAGQIEHVRQSTMRWPSQRQHVRATAVNGSTETERQRQLHQ